MKERRIIFALYEGAELLDFSGPASVFSAANRLADRPLYDILYASPSGQMVRTSCGVILETTDLKSLNIGPEDTVLVAGAYGSELNPAMSDTDLLDAMRDASKQAERYGSICSGTFVLAEAGLLEDKEITTHWAGVRSLSRRAPEARINENALYVTDERLWTSAGVTTGIDMALSMLAEDQGESLMSSVARQLVIYAHRPGWQSQFSDLLTLQSKAGNLFGELVEFLRANTDRRISVEEMADRMNMSERSFQRKFTKSFEQSPGRFHEQMRLFAAKDLLEANMSVENAALQAGFRSLSAFRKAFQMKFGVTPSAHRLHHQRH